MKLHFFAAACAALLILSSGIGVFTAYAKDTEGTSHEALASSSARLMTAPDPDDSSDKPSSKASSSKPSSSKASSSSKESSSRKETSSKASSKESSSKESSSRKESSRESSSKKESSESSSSSDQSSNNYLKSLKVVNRSNQTQVFSLSPSFSKGTLSYSVSVPTEVTGVALYGQAEDNKARVQYNNMSTLTDGKVNRLSVTCVAENGQKRVYSIRVARGTVISSEESGSDISDTSGLDSESSAETISLPPVAIGDIASGASLVSIPGTPKGNNLLLGIFAWIFLLGGLVIVVLVIFNGKPNKKSIGSSTVGSYIPSRRLHTKKPPKKAKKRLLGASYYSKYSKYKH